MPITRAMIAGGKTGGHLYPGVAVAEEILARNPDATITFVGTEDGIESRVLPKLGYPLVTINASRLKGGGLVARLLGLARVPVAMVQSWRALREARPEVVLGVGGYASGPAVLTAWLCRIPTAIQEQNAHPGLTNRILGKLVRAIYLGFDAAGRHFASPRAHATGNPIRHALVASLEAARDRGAPADTDATPTDTLRVLVFGGSQGARFLNENVPAALAQLAAARPTVELTVTHQTGLHDEEATRERYATTPLAGRVTVTPYIDDMPAAYAAADVAICRAGALTIAEITAMGLPALLVPFPFAADNHQEANAKVLADAGAAVLMPQREWNPDRLVTWLADLASDAAKRDTMATAARELARPDASRALVDHLETVAGVAS